MTPFLQRLVERELDRNMRALCDLVQRFPQNQKHIAYSLLGHAIAIADSFGCNVEEFLVELRKREQKPDYVLVPPGGGAS